MHHLNISDSIVWPIRTGLIVMERVLNPLFYFSLIFNMTKMGRKNKILLKKLHDFTDSVRSPEFPYPFSNLSFNRSFGSAK